MKRTKETHAKAVKMGDLTEWTDVKTMMANEGSRVGKYSGFVGFNKTELMLHLDIYLLHSISPSLQVEMKFKSDQEYPVNGSLL